MKIEKIKIENFRGIRQLEISEMHPNMNVLLGVNGAGKTTILDTLSILFSWLLARMKSSNAKGLLPQDTDITVGQKNCMLSVELNDGTKWSISKTRSYSVRNKKSLYQSDLSQMSLLTADILTAGERNSTVPVVLYYPVERAIASVPVNLHRGAEESRIWDVYTNALSGNANFRSLFEWYRRQEDIENELIRENPLYRDRSLETIRKAISIFFPDFNEMRVRRRPYQSMVIRKGNTVVEFAQLSQGEKCYLSLVCDIARRLAMANPTSNEPLKGEGIVLIDEVDLHLHPQWQAEVVSKLTLAFPNCQFIISTHSEQVLSELHQEQIIPISNGGKINISFNPYGKLTSQIATNYFGTKYHRNYKVAQDIERAFDAIQIGDTKLFHSLYEQLKTTIGTSDSDFVNLTIEAKRKGIL